MPRATKIVATLGPASSSPEVLERMIRAGVDVVRMNFSHGTETIARAIAASDAFSIAGGGDTLAAIAKYGIERDIGYISTGGGAFLEVLEGKQLPAFEILEKRAA